MDGGTKSGGVGEGLYWMGEGNLMRREIQEGGDLRTKGI